MGILWDKMKPTNYESFLPHKVMDKVEIEPYNQL